MNPLRRIAEEIKLLRQVRAPEARLARFSSYAAVTMAVATVVLAIITGVYTCQTRAMVDVMKTDVGSTNRLIDAIEDDSEISNRPYIAFGDIESYSEGEWLTYTANLGNTGKTPAVFTAFNIQLFTAGNDTPLLISDRLPPDLAPGILFRQIIVEIRETSWQDRFHILILASYGSPSRPNANYPQYYRYRYNGDPASRLEFVDSGLTSIAPMPPPSLPWD